MDEIGLFSWQSVLFPILVATLVPILIVTTTAFTKITVVMFLLRNALGVQQAPSGIVMNSIALVLAFFISAPVWMEIYQNVTEAGVDFQEYDAYIKAYPLVEGPLKDYLMRFATESQREFFSSAAKELWPESMHGYAQTDKLPVLIPAFIVSELTRAFEIGFMLYLPFVAIDMIVSNLLLSMGAMMVPPMLISLPGKLFLFVAADGWTRVLHGLLISYTG
jgi:type III secretion protein R